MTIIVGSSGQNLDVRSDGAVPLFQAEENEVFSWTSVTADIDANDTVILVTNDSTTKHLHITDMYVYSDVPSAIDFFTPAFATFSGTAITGIALNRTGVTVAPATALGDSAGDTLANIFATLFTNETVTDQFGVWLRLNGLLSLGFHDSAAIAIVEASAVSNSVIMGYYHDNHE